MGQESNEYTVLGMQPTAIWKGIRYNDGQREYRSRASSRDGATEILSEFGVEHSPSGSGKKACIEDLGAILSQFASSEKASQVFSSANLVVNPDRSNMGVLVSCTDLWSQGVMDSKGKVMERKSKQMCCFWIKNLCIAGIVGGMASVVTKTAASRHLEVEVAGEGILVYFSQSGQGQTWIPA